MRPTTLFWRVRERLLAREFDARPFRLLDVGAGNDSPLKLKGVFPNCEYHGIDRDVSYNLSASSLACADRFFTLDLTERRFESIPDDYYDAMVMSHVMEHLFNGERVLGDLVRKVRRGGVIYVEWPSSRSLFLPSLRGTLNFCDDQTHVRFYTRAEMIRILDENGCSVERAGVCRNVWRCLALPIILRRHRRSRGYADASDYWELTGFADFVWARKR